MKSEESENANDEVEGEIVAARRSSVAWAWLFPLMALAATGWLYWSNWKAKGPEILIHFQEAPGIEPGKTVLIYRGVQAGAVSKVHLDANLDTVAVTVTLKAFATELALEGTEFWIEQPVISVREIAGLESIIQGNSIHARTHGGTKEAKVFTALDEAPLTPLDDAELLVRLYSDMIPSVGRGTPVLHRGVTIGEVHDKAFDPQGRPAVEVIIFEKFVDRVRANSRFWTVSATALSASPGAVRLDIPSLQGLLDGSIAMDCFNTPGDPVKSGAEFELSPNETAARADGPRLAISFPEGAGLRAGETRVTSLGQPIGLVEKISTDPANKMVEVVARLESGFAALATEDSVFTITRPGISLQGIKGLDTIVTGPAIAFEPGSSKVSATRFAGRETPQIDWNPAPEDKDGIRVTVWAKTMPQLGPGAPVYHQGMVAGRVIEQRPGTDGRMECILTIDGRFREFLRMNSRFWRVPVATLAVGPGLLGVEVQGLSGLLQGGIAFDTIGTPGQAAAAGSDFELLAGEQAAWAVSEPIRILFENGEGLIPGKTELRYLGVPVGLVETVRTVEGRVEASARFKPGHDSLRRRGAEFAIIRPEIDLKGVKGLETLVGGVYISCSPGAGSEYAETFDAVPPEEPALMNEPGLEIVIESPSTKIDAGAAVCYNNTPVGEVVKKVLSRDGKRILLTARIRDEHANLVRTNSVFWDATEMDAKIGFLKVRIDTPSVLDPNGRISFHTPDAGGTRARKGTVFNLLPEEPDTKQGAAPSAPDERATKPSPFWKR